MGPKGEEDGSIMRSVDADGVLDELIRTASPEFRAALAAGCEMVIDTSNPARFVVRTKNPISVVAMPDGRIVVYEMIGS